MSGSAPSPLGASRRSAAVLAAILMIVASAAVATAGNRSTALPSSVAASPTTGASPSSDPESMYFPLPDLVVKTPPDIPTSSLEPTSEAGLVVGTSVPFTLGHCGLLSPVDVDGSLWQPVAGLDADAGPIESDDEVGELINATAGGLILTDPDTAEFRTPIGSLIILARAPGALDYPLCM